MILYRKGTALRVRRMQAPEPPFFCATQLAPYAARRATPLSIDHLALRVVAGDRIEVGVAENVRDELERGRVLTQPVMVDASGGAERVFRRGEEALRHLDAHGIAAVHLISTRGALPAAEATSATVVISAWPLAPSPLGPLFAEAAARQMRWGVFVPVVYPLTTEIEPLRKLAGLAAAHGAAFLASGSVESDPVARQATARLLDLEPEDDHYAMLFHGSVEPIQLSTERHIAALAAEHGLADRILLPEPAAPTNWNASVLLTATAARMFAMELDLDRAAAIARSGRIIAALDKPLTRIAASASLTIIGGIDETSAEMLTDWLARGSASFAERVDEQWRLPRG